MEKARLGEVPVVDLKCATCDLASEVGQALKRFGFFYVSNHGIPQELLTSQLEQNRRLFDLPDQVKRSMAFNVTLDIGYTGGTGTSQALDPNAGIQAADTKEGFMIEIMMPHIIGPKGATGKEGGDGIPLPRQTGKAACPAPNAPFHASS